jgi:inner membrane protein
MIHAGGGVCITDVGGALCLRCAGCSDRGIPMRASSHGGPAVLDSLTHIVLGGSIAAAVTAPGPHRRAALVAGAIFGSLPDIDVPILGAIASDPVTRMTWHRGPAHSLIVLIPLGLLLCWCLRRWWEPMREAPARWSAALMLALLSHPLLDALTVYGTQLWWPLPYSPTMWATLFIADPLVTLPVLVGATAAWFLRDGRSAQRWAAIGLCATLAYVGWSIVAKQLVEHAVDASLAGTSFVNVPRLVEPTAFNTLLWRIVVLTPDGYLEGERSLVADRGPIHFRSMTCCRPRLDDVAGFPDVARLRWFASGFVKAQAHGDTLVVSDLRMGSEPDYFFNFAVARRAGEEWKPIPTHSWALEKGPGATLQDRWHYLLSGLGDVWQRIGHEPPDAANGAGR